MARLIGAQRWVLQAILDLSQESAEEVADSQIAQVTGISPEDLRHSLETLEADGYANVVRTTEGLRASITAQGKLTLRQLQPFKAAPSPASEPGSSPAPSSDSSRIEPASLTPRPAAGDPPVAGGDSGQSKAATRGKRHRALVDFLVNAFEDSGLYRFLRDNDYDEIAGAVNRNVGLVQYCFDVVEALDRTGRIDPDLFERLSQERPARRAEIESLMELVVGMTHSFRPPASVPASTAASLKSTLDRTSLVRTVTGLSPGDMAKVLALIEGAAAQVGRYGTVSEQAADLIRWAESSTGPGLEAIRRALENFR
jgi:hypothetical protein